MIRGTLDVGLAIKDYLLTTPLGTEVPDIKVETTVVFPTADDRTEFIQILPKRSVDTKFFKKGFVEVNVYVPDKYENYPDSARLRTLQRLSWDALENYLLNDGQDTWWVQMEGTPTLEKDDALHCHFSNTRVVYQLFKH
ncbi:MAG: hypothetical protein LBB27_01070 [Tannerellaceae bacterium]|jgi:hypothetical protein|nr:hypothetical protein [Tannerellaceae bacterium]